ncbi:MAG: HEPN domain-containing protein [Micrococcales bacterium]|nr:HEPN domain-containing protein [Micrococcales bacterium]MCL2666210.1 HEPN domain-containing protein [Micrococcales bacterium]
MTNDTPAPGAPWTTGALVVRRLVDERRLDQVVPDTELAARQLHHARQHLDAAREHADRFPMPALTSAYDAARLALTALLEHQGLRPRADGSHLTVEEAIAAQLGPAVGRKFRTLRLLRHSTEYPSPGDTDITVDEVHEALELTEALLPAVERLTTHMGVFR